MKHTFQPEALKRVRLYQDAEYDYLVLRARECLIWRISPDYWDTMSPKEHAAWHAAWQEITEERNKANK